MAKLSPVKNIPTFACIIRATWERGSDQIAAIREIDNRGSWLSADQLTQAGLTKARYREICGRDPNTGARAVQHG
jgi:hypothetical protein